MSGGIKVEDNLELLFYKCAYENNYQVAGEDTDYKFIEDDDTLYIFFKGSDSDYDWKMNFWFTEKVYKMFRVHKGFYKEYNDVRNIILDKCYSKNYKKIIVIGYSLGGALTQLALEDIEYHFPELDVKAYAFESPRCLKVPKKYKGLWKNLTRIETNWDLVCHCPPRLFGYNNLGQSIKNKGDVSLVLNKLPKCIKSHYPQVVYDGLNKYEQNL